MSFKARIGLTLVGLLCCCGWHSFCEPTSRPSNQETIGEVNDRMTKALYRSNFQYPQINTGIELYMTAVYFSRPFSLSQFLSSENSNPRAEAAERALDKMNAAHKAYGIQPSQAPLGVPLDAGFTTAVQGVFPVVLRILSRRDGKIQADTFEIQRGSSSWQSATIGDVIKEWISSKIAVLDGLFFERLEKVWVPVGDGIWIRSKNLDWEKVQHFGQGMMAALTSKEMSDVSEGYRNFEAYMHRKGRATTDALEEEAPAKMVSKHQLPVEMFRILCNALCDERYPGDKIKNIGFGLRYGDIETLVQNATHGSRGFEGVTHYFPSDGELSRLFNDSDRRGNGCDTMLMEGRAPILKTSSIEASKI